jgi:nucleoid DNA-binding protein
MICYALGQMKKSDFINRVARQQGMKTGAVADQMDQAVTKIIRALRRGQRAHLPGLGTIAPGKSWTFHPDEKSEGRDER